MNRGPWSEAAYRGNPSGLACHVFGPFGYAVRAGHAGAWSPSPNIAPNRGHASDPRPLFIGLVIGVILIIGGLEFFPAQALGPIVEHFQMLQAIAATH